MLELTRWGRRRRLSLSERTKGLLEAEDDEDLRPLLRSQCLWNGHRHAQPLWRRCVVPCWMDLETMAEDSIGDGGYQTSVNDIRDEGGQTQAHECRRWADVAAVEP